MPKNKKISPFKVPVLLTLKAYKRIVGYAIRYANDDMNSEKWREVYGILIGSIENNSKVVVKDAIPMVVGDRAGVKYENKQYVDMAQIDASVFERSIQDKKKDFIIGWWHSHPGFGFFFSPIDCMTQLGYQIPNPYAVGLIFDHCKKKSDLHFLGVAGLRLKDPELGISSTYDLIKLNYELEGKKMVLEIETVIKEVNKNINKVLKEVEYIDDVLRKKALAQLQRNYGLILVPKEDIIITDDEEMADEDEKYLYEWDPDFFRKSYRIPKFREKIEKTIAAAYDELDKLTENVEKEKYQTKKNKLIKKIQNLLKKPNEWYDKLMEDFSKRIEIIFPYYSYLDTDERKVIEYFEERSSEYFKILDELNNRSQLNLEGFD
ncbi:MAG: Mov34/MPN/PAD-1 family protein [Candidatus Hodarchaeota archaeon]